MRRQASGTGHISGTYSDFTAFTELEARGRDDRESEDGPADYGQLLAAGDIDADGVAEIIVGAGPDPRINPSTSSGETGHSPAWRLMCILTEETSRKDSKEDDGEADEKSKYRYGVNVAADDMDGDGKAEIITGPGRAAERAAGEGLQIRRR